MPIGVLSRIPNSVSRGGKCLSNLRGVTPSAPYDYANPSRLFNVGENTSSISTEGSGAWSNTIQRAYYLPDSDGNARIDYQEGLLSNATSGTILFRMYIQPFNDPGQTPLVQTVFKNGADGMDGYGIRLTYDYDGSSEFYWNLHFCRLQDVSSEWIKLNVSAPLQPETWYQFSVRFRTISSGGDEPTISSQVDVYQDGALQTKTTMNFPIDTPTASVTSLLQFFGRMTDFAFLETQLSDSQLAAYGTAPYI
jgi:hypothetical protein